MFTKNLKSTSVQFALIGLLFAQTFTATQGTTRKPIVAETDTVEAGKAYVMNENTRVWDSPMADIAALFDPFSVQADTTPPRVISITRKDPNPSDLGNVSFFVLFSESVIKIQNTNIGVDPGDFKLTKSGLPGASIEFAVGIDDLYTVSVKTGTDNGTVRLDLVDNNTIRDAAGNRLGGPALGDGNFSKGETYLVIQKDVKPGNPVLVSPPNGTRVTTVRPVFDWKNTNPLAHHYRIQVAEDNSFSTLVIDETDFFESTFTPSIDLTPGKLYYWRVRAFSQSNKASSWSPVWTFKTALDKPILLSPLHTDSLQTDRPTLTWDAVPFATQYQLQVSALGDFSTLLVNTNVSTTELQLTKDLPQKKTLYWRVRAKTSAVAGLWSTRWTFKTGNPPSVPVLVAPANDASVQDLRPRLNWQNSTGPTVGYYEVEVDDSIDFSSPEIVTTSPISEFTPDADLASGTTYYWRVRAFSAAGHFSGWSRVWSFHSP